MLYNKKNHLFNDNIVASIALCDLLMQSWTYAGDILLIAYIIAFIKS